MEAVFGAQEIKAFVPLSEMAGIDRDAALSLLRGLIDHVVSLVFRLAFHCHRLGDPCSPVRLAFLISLFL